LNHLIGEIRKSIDSDVTLLTNGASFSMKGIIFQTGNQVKGKGARGGNGKIAILNCPVAI